MAIPTKTKILNHFIFELKVGCVFKKDAKLPDNSETKEKIINA